MADLKWDQIAAPNLTGASDILRNANSSFNNGFDALGQTLESSRLRTQERVSNGAIPELVGVKNEAEIPGFLDYVSKNVAPENMSPALREAMLGLRKDATGNALTRSQAGTEGSKSGLYDAQGNLYNAQADSERGAEGRTGIDFTRRIASEDQLMSQAGDIVGAREGAIGGNFGIGHQNSGAPNSGGGTNSFDYIASKEGFSEGAYFDVTAQRTGFGSDTVTRPDGSIERVNKGTTVTREDASRDLQRRIDTEFRPAVVAAVGDSVYSGMNSTQQAAVDSITYNYGTGFWDKDYAKPIAAALRNGDFEGAAKGIEGLKGHNEGVNAGRRQEEANMLRMTGGTGTGRASNADFQSSLAGLAGIEGNAVSPEKWLEFTKGNQDAFGIGQEQRQADRTSDFTFANDVYNENIRRSDSQVATDSLSLAQKAAMTTTTEAEAKAQLQGLGLAPDLLKAALGQFGAEGGVAAADFQTPLNAPVIPQAGALKTAYDTTLSALNIAEDGDPVLRSVRRAEDGMDATAVAAELLTDLPSVGNTETQIVDAINYLLKENPNLSPAVAKEFLVESVRGSNPLDFQWAGTGAGYRDAANVGERQIDIQVANKLIKERWTPQAQRDAATRSSQLDNERAQLDQINNSIQLKSNAIQLEEERLKNGTGKGPTDEMIKTRDDLIQQMMSAQGNSQALNQGQKDVANGDNPNAGADGISAAVNRNNTTVGLDGRPGITETMNESMNMVEKLTGLGGAIMSADMPAAERSAAVQQAMAEVNENQMVPSPQKAQIMQDLALILQQTNQS
jgi:GH24 family phage-related lysozyme (muramidase)